MKKLALSNPSYRYLETSFKEWLDVQGYAPSTVYNLPTHVRELLYQLETQNINHIRQLQIQDIEDHYENLKERSNQRKGGSLSNGHLNKHIQAMKLFTEYLRIVCKLEITTPILKSEESVSSLVYLTLEEINLLFKTTYQEPENKPNTSPRTMEAIQSRDRAMLAIFYGCGLRRNEGVHLNLSDVDFDKSINRQSGTLHVRKGKNNQERFVPINTTSLKHLQAYIYDYRPLLVRSSTVDALFLGQWGLRMQGQGLLLRLKQLQHRSGDLDLLEKEIGLHTLRHSIATHLMNAGMSIESISRFLGHSSLESTQIYTHLPKEQNYKNIPRYETKQLHEDE